MGITLSKFDTIQKGYPKGVYHRAFYGPTFGHRAVLCGSRSIYIRPGRGFDNWEGNTLCGGQTYDQSEDRYECKLTASEVFQVMLSD